jgi:Tfp pilus assembly major pilin PilA
LGGEYIPIIKVSETLSKEWIQLIGLKAKLSLSDLLNILIAISNDTTLQGKFKRDNIKRLGLVYEELLIGINELTIQEEKEIKDWAKKSKFLCNDFVSRKNSEVIWLRIEGFNEYNDKIPSILIPKNVNVDDKVEKLFSLFGVPIVDKCDYKVKEEEEDVKLSIKILEFLPALSLILRSRMKIKDEEDYLNKAYKSVENFKFYICKEILLILNYGDIEIKGSSVKYYLSDEGFYFTNSWQNPLERFNISHYLSSFLKCNGLEQEIQLLLELSNYQVNEYLESVGLSLEMVMSLPIYTSIQEKVISLKESIRPSKSSQAHSSVQFDGSEEEDNSATESNQDAVQKKDKDETEYDFIKEVENFISSELENTEWAEHIPELKNILELSKNHPKEKQKLYNFIAKLRLAKATIIQFDIADKDFNQLIKESEKYFVHSARGSFAYIHTNEILRMRDEGFKMALDFGSKTPIKIYQTAEEILSLNTSHLLAYQYEKTMDDLFDFCEHNRDANKHLLVIDRDNSRENSNDIFKLLNPEDDYQ